MGLRRDDRAQSVQIGAVILFGFLVITLSLYQAQVVPAQNKDVEFRHNQDVQDRLADLRNAVVSAATGDGPPVSVPLGTRYPPRTFLVNPPPASGTLETTTVGPGHLRLANVTAVRPEVADFLSGSRAVPTKALVYRPSYNVYDNAPATVIGATVLYNRFDGANRTESGQHLVDGNRITLIAVNGSLSRNGVRPTTVDPAPVSVGVRTVTVTNNTTGPPTLVVPTALSAETWRDLLAAELDPAGNPTNARYVRAVEPVPGSRAVRLVLENATYELRMAKVGVGDEVSAEGPAYVTPVSGGSSSVPEGGSQEVTVEVRDAFNNPVSGASLNATLVSSVGGNLSTTTAGPAVNLTALGTDADGRVTLTYTAPDDITGSQSATVQIRVGVEAGPAALRAGGFDTRGPMNATVNLTVTNTDGSGVSDPGSNINPTGRDAVVLKGATIDNPNNNPSSKVTVTLKNLDENDTRTISEARFNFYSVDRQSQGAGNQRPLPKLVDFEGVDLRSASEGGAYRSVGPISISPGSTTDIDLSFYEDVDGNTAFEVKQGDFFVMSVIFEDGGSATYFVAPIDGGGGGNSAPTADANGPYSVSEGGTTGLDGTASSDPDGDALSYTWQITGNSYNATIQNPSSATPTFDASGASVSQNRDVTVELTVSDGNGGSDTATTTVTIQDAGGGNSVPAINDLTVTEVGGSDKLSIEWNVSDAEGFNPGNVNVTVVDQSDGSVAYQANFTPDANPYTDSTMTGKLTNQQTYEVILTVRDGDGGSTQQSVQKQA